MLTSTSTMLIWSGATLTNLCTPSAISTWPAISETGSGYTFPINNCSGKSAQNVASLVDFDGEEPAAAEDASEPVISKSKSVFLSTEPVAHSAPEGGRDWGWASSAAGRPPNLCA